MSKLVWDKIGERLYETGVDRGVLYLRGSGEQQYSKGVAWNGLTSINERPTGAEPNPIYADNIKYLNLISAEEFEATIDAFTYPDEFEECDGSREISEGVAVGQQDRSVFGLSYRTLIGNDEEGTNHGYKLHLVYGATASTSDKQYETVNETPDAITFSWEISTVPVEVPGMKPTAVVTINSTKVDGGSLAELEEILYGTSEDDPRLPLPVEIMSIFGEGEEG